MFRTHVAGILGFVAVMGSISCVAVSGQGAGEEQRAGDRSAAQSVVLPADLFGINVATDAPGGEAIAAIGAAWVRLELRDGSTGPELSSGVIDHYRATLADYRAHGQKVLLVLDYTTHGGFGGGATQFCPAEGDWDGWRAGFLSRVGHAAAALGDLVDAWQIWNEPDHPCGAAPGYDPYLPPEVFAPLMRDAYAAIRASGSGAPIVLGGLESGDPSYMDRMVDATGGTLADYADAVAIQIYGVVPNDAWCEPGGKAEGEYLNCDWGRLDGKVHQYFERSGGLPIWVTEVGLRTEDPQKQADYLEDAYAAFGSTGDRLSKVFWFAYSDAMVPPFGLTDGNWQPKPYVYERYQILTGAAGGGQQPGSEEASPLSCGDLAVERGWSISLCEWNGNGACGGEGTPTWDCDHCCGW